MTATTTHDSQPLLMPFGRRPGPLHSVLLHPAGGGLGPYAGLVTRLARRGPVHGIRAAGLLPGEQPDRTIGAMTDRYLELLDTLPRVPDVLIGWSLGGLLAWELSARLAARGTAPAVAMVDSFAEPWSAYGAPHAGLRASILGTSVIPLGADEERRAARTADAHLQACAGHHAAHHPCPGPTLLVTCENGDRDRQVAAWLRRMPDLTLRSLDCGHFEAFRAPHVRPLLGHVDAFLAEL
ncbi:thioesterase domain-containing protein [Streptomyces sp. NPDC049577]|uniref:thioesterase domain-containing protein n=1 Tax=Streptomyces sp. NPDC049577 TaxID=3155153 RepID=UPI003425747D